MHFSRTILPRKRILGLALTSLCALGTATARPAAAQSFSYTLSGVTFADGATASGTFSYDFTTSTFGAFDVTTTDGLSDGLLGVHYVAPTATASATSNFDFRFNSGLGYLNLNSLGPDNVAGTIALQPGTSAGPTSLFASGEDAPPASGGLPLVRVITAGSLIATPAAVPEASTTVSLGLLLAFGLGGVVIAAKRKKAADA